ncbi:HpcH/HpaI aldolase/citrate lyase family protein [Candidatus Formimonas warabiya]|uniref:HpcH/HpaI aldolase/citrate lyase domain-containing protein n=1 Tax=Formimonas warabiya TaxID=1761012 RepID=A0A3G1KPX6_FORW1|nr:aldolase/citrate lyase family protein [Candidatus Formimonas warabiya]ATW24487.1 hypothetical protein DCMF_06575 [Candidatus Formimonas warabiya]
MKKCNSFLFIPANKYKYFYNKKILDADAVIIDFEDTIIQEDILEYINDINYILDDIFLKHVYLRVNSEEYFKIVGNINLKKINGIMIPKFCLDNMNIGILHNIINLKKEILILIESPRGILDLKETLQNFRIMGVFFGSEDYISEINGLRNRENMLYPRLNILNISKAFGVYCYDTIFPDLNSENLFKEEVDYSHEMGFDGKLAIHPSQLDYINKRFKICIESVEKYKMIVQLYYENIKQNKTNVIVIDGKIFEPPHIKRFEKMIKEFEDGGKDSE